jgi:hypothetical protein
MDTTKNNLKSLNEAKKHGVTKGLKELLQKAQTPEYGDCEVEYRSNGTIVVTPKDKKIARRTIHPGERAEHPVRRWLEGVKKEISTGKQTSATTTPSTSKKKFMKDSIENIINNNNLTEADIPFVRSFYSHLLKEAEDREDFDLPAKDDEVPANDEAVSSGEEQVSPEDFTPEKTKADFDNSLEKDTEKDSFDVEGLDPNVSTESIKQIKEWSGKLDKFAEFLNNPSTQSLHKILADNDKPGSLLRGVTRKASDSITRIAGEIEKLKEVLNSFIIMAPKKLRDSEQLQ